MKATFKCPNRQFFVRDPFFREMPLLIAKTDNSSEATLPSQEMPLLSAAAGNSSEGTGSPKEMSFLNPKTGNFSEGTLSSK